MHCDVVQLVVDRSSSSSLCRLHSVTSGHWIDTCTGRNTASHTSITQITRIQAEKTNACRSTSVEKAKVGLLTDRGLNYLTRILVPRRTVLCDNRQSSIDAWLFTVFDTVQRAQDMLAFLVFGFRAFYRSALSARVPESQN